MSDDVTFERDVMAHAVRSLEYFRRATLVLKNHNFFKPDHRYIFKVYKEVLESDGVLCDPAHFAGRLKVDFAPGTPRFSSLVDTYKDLLAHRPTAPSDSLEQIRSYAKTAIIKAQALDVSVAVSKGDLEAARGVLAAAMEQIQQIELTESPVDYAETVNDRLARYSAAPLYGGVTTGIPSLDRAINGGLRPGHVALLSANTNVGKSSMAVALGAHGAENHDDVLVLHFFTEETQLDEELRYDARFSDIDRSILARGLLPAALQHQFSAALTARKTVLERINLMSLGMGGSAAQILAIIKEKRNAHPTKLFLVIIDSPDHLQTAQRVSSNTERVGRVYAEARAITVAPTLGSVCMWQTTQNKRDMAGKDSTNEGVADSYEKARLASIGLGVRDTAESGDADPKTFVMNIYKNRVGTVKRLTIYAEAHLSVCRIIETVATLGVSAP